MSTICGICGQVAKTLHFRATGTGFSCLSSHCVVAAIKTLNLNWLQLINEYQRCCIDVLRLSDIQLKTIQSMLGRFRVQRRRNVENSKELFRVYTFLRSYLLFQYHA